MTSDGSNTSVLTTSQRIKASSVGASISALLTTPFDVVKTRMQANNRAFHHIPTAPAAAGSSLCHLHQDIAVRLSPHAVCLHHLQPQSGAGSGAAKDMSCLRWCCGPAHLHTSSFAASVSSPPIVSSSLNRVLERGSAWRMAQYVVRTEGVPSLWSGLTPALMLAVPASVIYYSLTDTLCQWMGYSAVNSNGREWVPPVVAALSRTVAVLFIQPLEVMRTRLQLRQTPVAELLRLVRRDGGLALRRGLGATLLRDIPFSAIYWTVFETCKRHYVQRGGGERHAGQIYLDFAPAAVFGATAGLLAALATQPADVIKTHRQVELGESASRRAGSAVAHAQRKSTWGALHELYVRRGVAALYTGSGPRVMKVMPACAIMLGSFEYLKLSFARSST